jgi:RNA polymerase sigma factor (sigma-70 family)
MRLPAPLSPEEQIDLAVRARAGDLVARNRLVECSLTFVYGLARKVRGAPTSLEIDDLVAAGVEGLIRAIQKFDPTIRVRFLTYASHWIWAMMRRAVLEAKGISRSDAHRKRILVAYQAALAADMNEEQARIEAGRLYNVRPDTVARIVLALTSKFVSLDGPFSAHDARAIVEALSSEDVDVEEWTDDVRNMHRLREVIRRFRAGLTARNRVIFDARVMADTETLAEIGARLGVTRERIRQLEVRVRRRFEVALCAAKLQWVAPGFGSVALVSRGLQRCRHCDAPRVPGYRICRQHLKQRRTTNATAMELNKARSRERGRAAKAVGFCRVCTLRPIAPGQSTRCRECRAARRKDAA